MTFSNATRVILKGVRGFEPDTLKDDEIETELSDEEFKEMWDLLNEEIKREELKVLYGFSVDGLKDDEVEVHLSNNEMSEMWWQLERGVRTDG